MREEFQDKMPGDELLARDINRLQQVFRRVARFRGGTYENTFHYENMMGSSPRMPSFVGVFEIVDMTAEDDEDSDLSSDSQKHSGLYLGILRWYDHQTGEWKTLENTQELDTPDVNQWLIDARDTALDLQTGQTVVCFWNHARGAFVPCETIDTPLIDVTCSYEWTGTDHGDPVKNYNFGYVELEVIYRERDGNGTLSTWRVMPKTTYTQTIWRHRNDEEPRHASVRTMRSRPFSAASGISEIHLGLAAFCSIQPATVDAALRVEVRPDQSREVGVNGSAISNDILEMDTGPSVLTNDRTGMLNAPVFEVADDHVIVKGPITENPADSEAYWLVKIDAQAQFEYGEPESSSVSEVIEESSSSSSQSTSSASSQSTSSASSVSTSSPSSQSTSSLSSQSTSSASSQSTSSLSSQSTSSLSSISTSSLSSTSSTSLIDSSSSPSSISTSSQSTSSPSSQSTSSTSSVSTSSPSSQSTSSTSSVSTSSVSSISTSSPSSQSTSSTSSQSTSSTSSQSTSSTSSISTSSQSSQSTSSTSSVSTSSQSTSSLSSQSTSSLSSQSTSSTSSLSTSSQSTSSTSSASSTSSTSSESSPSSDSSISTSSVSSTSSPSSISTSSTFSQPNP